MKLTKEDIRNGWTVETLTAYRRDREMKRVGRSTEYVPLLVSGNVVTELKRGKPVMVLEGPRGYSPFTRRHQP